MFRRCSIQQSQVFPRQIKIVLASSHSLWHFLWKSVMVILATSNKTYFYWPFQRQIHSTSPTISGRKKNWREGVCKPGDWSHGHHQGKSRLPKRKSELCLGNSFWSEKLLPLDRPTSTAHSKGDTTAAAAHFASWLSRAQLSINPFDFKWHPVQTSFSSSFFSLPFLLCP